MASDRKIRFFETLLVILFFVDRVRYSLPKRVTESLSIRGTMKGFFLNFSETPKSEGTDSSVLTLLVCNLPLLQSNSWDRNKRFPLNILMLGYLADFILPCGGMALLVTLGKDFIPNSELLLTLPVVGLDFIVFKSKEAVE